MQSGQNKTGFWILEFEADSARKIEPLMGYTSSSDMNSQIRMKFDSQEAAISYAQRSGIAYHVVQPKKAKRRAMTYAENFSFYRSLPWTH